MSVENAPARTRAVVWIVDDLPSEVASLARRLSAEFTLEIFESGPRMLERLKSAPAPDVLVIEQRQRGLAGVELCRELRATAAPVELPILLLTDPLDEDEILEGLAAGIDDYLFKPFHPALLTARLASLVRVKRAAEQARRERERDDTERLLLDKRLRHRTQLLAVGTDLGVVLIRKGTLRDTLQAAAQVLVDHLGAAFARIWTLDEPANLLELQASAGLYTHLDGAHGRVPVGQFKIGTIAATRSPHLTNAVDGDPLVPEQAWARREGLTSFAGYPLLVEDQLVGVLALFARTPLAEDTLRVLAAAASSIALAIERERTEEARSRSQAWLTRTLQSVGDALIATDDAGRVVFMNPVAVQLTGWTSEDARGRPIEEVLDIVHETTRARVENPVAKVLREGTIVGLANHTVLRSKEGSEVAIDDSAAPIRDPQGRLFGAVLVFRDVSEARRKDAELRVFRALVDASPDFVAFGSLNGRPGYLNRAGMQLVGIERHDSLLETTIPDYLSPGTRRPIAAAMLAASAAGQPFHGLAELSHVGTEEAIPIALSTFTVNNPDGTPLMLAAIGRDRRDQVRAEAERERLLTEAQAARREADIQRERLTTTFTQAPMAVGILRGDDNVVDLVNDGICRIWGLPRATLLGRPIFDLLVDAKKQGFPELLAGVRRSGEAFVGRELTATLPRLDGGGVEDVILNFVYQPLRAADGSMSDILIVATDVTLEVRARDRAEKLAAELRASEERVRRVVEASGAGLWDLDVATGHIGADTRMIELMGLPPGSTMSLESALDNIHADERPGVAAAVAAALAGENEGRYLVEFRSEETSSAPRRWVESRAQVLFDADGKAAHLAGAMMDISARKLAEIARKSLHEEIQRSEESFRTLAEAIPQQVWTSRPDGGLDFVNDRVLAYFASTKEHVLEAGWQRVTHPDDLPGVLERWTHSLATGDLYEIEFRLERADGTYRWHLGRAVAVRDARGEIVKWFGTSTDIHEAKQIREDLEERARFEQHLLGIVSHDLRNPLGAILLGATGLLEVAEDEWVTSMAQRIHSSAERSTRMISDLLDFTQARLGGGIRLTRRTIDLHALAATTIHEVEVAYPERSVELTQAGETRGAWDSDRLAQVVANLVTNALKYSPAGTPVKVVVAEQQGMVELTVHNEGAPVPPERLPRIFEPLQRATDEIDMKTRSVGLGLYIVEAIVKAHGGTVNVVSTAVAGTTFTVRLPRYLEDER